jgi:ABC-type branched-subunit amino acid transport system ATPase component
MALLATESLTKRYGGLTANDGVAIALAAGEIRGLVAPNGVGTFISSPLVRSQRLFGERGGEVR